MRDVYKGPESELTGRIIECAIEVHRYFGCGLKEDAYESALCWELHQLGLKIERQKPCPVIYKGIDFTRENAYPRRIDILVDDKVVVECKALPTNDYIFKAQCLTYLKMLDLRVGLVLNFGLPTLKAGIQHVINETREEYLDRLKKERPFEHRAVLDEERASKSLAFGGVQAYPQKLSVSPRPPMPRASAAGVLNRPASGITEEMENGEGGVDREST